MENRRKPICVVDDSPIVAEMTAQFLQNTFTSPVKIYPSGEAFLADRETRAGIIILDYYLDAKDKHALNGLQVVSEVRKHNPDVPIILLTGVSDHRLRKEIEAADIQSVVNKEENDMWGNLEKEIRKFL